MLLHGLGDTAAPFTQLGRSLNFPETACIAIRAPSPLPFDLDGYHWCDDVVFDQSNSSGGGLDADAGFDKACVLLTTVVEEVLVRRCGWNRCAVFFLGFGQGGMAALQFVAEVARDASSTVVDGQEERGGGGGGEGEDAVEFGGVVSIGGPVPHSAPTPMSGRGKIGTPVLLLGAEHGSAVTEAAERRARNDFKTVAVVRWRGRTGDGMMRNVEEARPIMEFFARRLKSRAGVPDGAVEL